MSAAVTSFSLSAVHMRESIVSTWFRLGSGLGLWQGLGLGLGLGFGFEFGCRLGLQGPDRRVLVLLEHPPLDGGERRDHALGTAEAGPALVLCLPTVLDQLGQAGGGRVPPVAAVGQLRTDALSE